MATISDSDAKILWGRAAGMCSNPDCNEDLTETLANGGSFNIGEMAHIIARQPDGPRGMSIGGSNEYGNLILLCPTCHRKIDKSPEGTYTVERLREWKTRHERKIRDLGKNQIVSDLQELKQRVYILLVENKTLFDMFGPKSESANDPESNVWRTWKLRKLDRIIPNNRKIINLVESNSSLLTADLIRLYALFKAHAEAFEENQYEIRDRYPLFPTEFAEAFST